MEGGMAEPIIIIDPEIVSGTPCFRGTRVPFKNLIDYLEGGHSLGEFLQSCCYAGNGDSGARRSEGITTGQNRVKILLDECFPLDFRHSFPEHDVHTVQWAGFKGKKNEIVDHYCRRPDQSARRLTPPSESNRGGTGDTRTWRGYPCP